MPQVGPKEKQLALTMDARAGSVVAKPPVVRVGSDRAETLGRHPFVHDDGAGVLAERAAASASACRRSAGPPIY